MKKNDITRESTPSNNADVRVITEKDNKTTTITRHISMDIAALTPEEKRMLADYADMSFRAANMAVAKQHQLRSEIEDIAMPIAAQKAGHEHPFLNPALKRELGPAGVDRYLKILKEEISAAEKIIMEKYGCSIQNITYRLLAEKFPTLSSYIISAINSSAVKNYRADLFPMNMGDKTVRTYKQGMPIPFTGTGEFKVQPDGSYTFKFIKTTFKLIFGRDRSGNQQIVDQIIAGEYKFCDSAIIYAKNEKTKDMELKLLLVSKQPRQPVKLDKSKILATNLGMISPITTITSDGTVQNFGDELHFLSVRKQFEVRKQKLQRQVTLSRGGHGVARKTKALDRLRGIENDWVQTFNHKLSNAVIQHCMKNNIGTIHMEDLLGAGEDMEKTYILRNWSYFQLQQFIGYKAERYGIDIVKKEAFNITSRCNTCGNIDKNAVHLDTRKYMCTNPDCKDHKNRNKEKFRAPDIDYNAAKNVLIAPISSKKKGDKFKRKKAANEVESIN